MKGRKPIQYRKKAILQKEIGSVCPFCQSTDVEHFEIHHIDEMPSNNEIENLIMLCPTCHSKITKGDIIKDEVIKIKRKVSGKTTPELPPKIKDIIEKGRKVRNESQLSKAGAIFEKALEFAEKLNDPYAIAKCKLQVASLLNDKHEFPETALKYAKEAEIYFREIHLEKDLACALYEAALSELKSDCFDSARIHLKEAVSIYISVNDKFHEAMCYHQMGWMEHGQGYLNKSKELFHKAIEIFENEFTKHDKKTITSRIAACYAHIALVNKTEMNIPDAEANLLKAIHYFKEGDMKISLGQSLLFLAELEVKTQRVESGRQHLREAGLIFQEIKEFRWLAEALDLLSKIEYTFGDKERAIEIFHSAIKAIEQTKDIKNKLKYYGKLAELYKVEKKYPEAEKLNLQILELAEIGKNDKEYYHSILGIIDIKNAENKIQERNEAGKKGIEKLKQFLLIAQRESKRARLLGDIASLYTECENYFEAKKYFSLSKDVFVILSDNNGISKCLGSLAYIYQLEGDYEKEREAYTELKQLTQGSHNYYDHAVAIFNLCRYEIDNDNFELAKKYFNEVEYLNYNYGLNLEEKLEQLELILDKAKEAHIKPEKTIDELIEDFYSEVNYYPDERIHHLRFWIFFHGNELFANYKYLEGIKFLILTDNTDVFLSLSSELNAVGELFLQSFNIKFETGKATIFHYPKERLIPQGVSFMASKAEITKDDIVNKKVTFSKKTKEEYEEEKEKKYSLKQSHTSELGNYTIFFVKDIQDSDGDNIEEYKKAFRENNVELNDNPGNLILGYPIIFPEPFENLLLNSTPEEILKRKIFFDISDRAHRKDKFYSDLCVAKQLNCIPVYFTTLPKSERVFVLENAKVELPIFNERMKERCPAEVNQIKNILTRFFANVENSKFSLQNLKIDIAEKLENLSVSKKHFTFYLLNFTSFEKKEKIIALVAD